MYFYRQNNIPNFLHFPSTKYEGTKQARARIMKGLVSSFMLIPHTTLLIKTLFSRARGLVPTADIFFIRKIPLPKTNSPSTPRNGISIKPSQESSLSSTVWSQPCRETFHFISKYLSDQSIYQYVVQTWDMD